MKLYLIGSLRNEKIPLIGNEFRQMGYEVFDDWFAPGPEADDFWKSFEQTRNQTYLEALNSPAAKHIFEFDKSHLDSSDVAVLVCPAGKSAHLELGYMIGKGKPGYILLEETNDRWDVMYQFAIGLFYSTDGIHLDIMRRILA